MVSQKTSSRNSNGAFDVRNYLDNLTPTKEKGKYICPVCGGNDLSINLKTGAYSCFSTGCDSKAIRDTIAPLTTTYTANKPPKAKSNREKEKDATIGAAMVESKVNELVWMIDAGSITPQLAAINLSEWCREHGHHSFSANQLLKEDLRKINAIRSGENPDDEDKSRILKDYELLKREFGDRLEWNLMTEELELDGAVFDPMDIKVELEVTYRLKPKSSKDSLNGIIDKIARARPYRPVVRYLDRVYQEHGDDTSILDDMAKRNFGRVKPIHQTAIVKFLISAVARAYQPGCKCDTALILQGNQGTFKSTFFKVLASEPWFDDTFGSGNQERDELNKLHEAWIIEWAELETIFKKRDVSQVKKLVTTTTDRIRDSYGRKNRRKPRPSIFVGTTNLCEFLPDDRENRRYWVIPVTKPVNGVQLERERDRIWAAAVSLYRQGHIWYLTNEEEIVMQEERAQYQSSDVWEELIEDFLAGREIVSMSEILDVVFSIDKQHQEKKVQNRVRDCLYKLGWKPTGRQQLYKGLKGRTWSKHSDINTEISSS